MGPTLLIQVAQVKLPHLVIILAHNKTRMVQLLIWSLGRNAPRPPETNDGMAIDTSLFAKKQHGNNDNLEAEEFMDAQDQGHANSDSDIEMVVETPGL